MNRRSFGKRVQAASAPPVPVTRRISETAEQPAVAEPADEEPLPVPQEADLPSIEDEIREWKAARKQPMPWKQIALMASLCFGLAAIILPDAVNEALQWPLYLLAALSLGAGLVRHRQERA